MQINFIKMAGAGNDFIIMTSTIKNEGRRFGAIAKEICARTKGIGADGLLVLEGSRKADFKMRIFNADGSEAEMCGNGIRCAALYFYMYGINGNISHKKNMSIETKAGIYKAELKGKNNVSVRMKDPEGIKIDVSLKLNDRVVRVNCINTGVPHAVVFVHGLDEIDVGSIGKHIRYHRYFKPAGTNVDFIQVIDDKNIKMRTYERGVEDETLACGTGAVASAIINVLRDQAYESGVTHKKFSINVHTKGGILKVYFERSGNKVRGVYLEGNAREVFKGEISLGKIRDDRG